MRQLAAAHWVREVLVGALVDLLLAAAAKMAAKQQQLQRLVV
jgi:hypothetical protein